MEDVKDLRSTEKREGTLLMEQTIKTIVDSRTSEVTSIIHKIRQLLKDDTTELSDLEIDDILLQLPIILYDSLDGQEVVRNAVRYG